MAIELRAIVVISDFKFDFIFEISHLNDPDINMHIGSRNHFDGLQTASVTSDILFDIKFVIRNPSYPEIICILALTATLVASEAMATSK